MHETNGTEITIIYLQGFQSSYSITLFVSFLLFIINFLTISGNLLIITMVSYSKSLHTPMYFFLSQLSITDILLTSSILPNIIHAVLVKDTRISLNGCITQFYFFSVSVTSECLLLTLMCYDRYLAICKPLHYPTIMTTHTCLKTVTIMWMLSILIMLIHTLTIAKLQFCGSNIVDHFFCDFAPLLEISCSDTSLVQVEVTLLSAVLVVIPFLIIILSYGFIIVAILKMSSVTRRQKAFSTCSSHLSVVSIFYGSLVLTYLVPSSRQSWNISKVLSLMYTVVTPLINPIIYSLRNKELNKAVKKLLNFNKVYKNTP